ncbi:MAG TPA: helix-turn-helix domain-containing protein [Ktedonobacteraceae bacterium]|nr:helix-turn-helix domain-containing protein [Ktedonobacteraceae bacterium]
MSINEHQSTIEEVTGAPNAPDVCGDTARAEMIMERAMCLLGDKWTLMIVYNLRHGKRRFGELLEVLGNISPKTLSQRLKQLEEIRLVERRAYAEIPPRVEYLLTDRGLMLTNILKAIQEFGENCLSDIPNLSL